MPALHACVHRQKFQALLSHDKGYSMYRAACATCARPVLPYLGVYLSDVTFIHQGNPDIMPSAEAEAAGATGKCIVPYPYVPYVLFSKVGCTLTVHRAVRSP